MSTPSHAEPDVELGEMTVAPAPTVVEELVADAQSSGSPAAPLSPTSAAAAAMTKSISAIEDTTSAHGASGTSGTPANAPKDATDVSGAPPAKPASFEELFGFADGLDRALLLMGLVFALGQGAVLPLMSQFFGDIIDAFVRREAGLISDSEFERLVNVNVVYFVILAVGAFVAAYIYNTAFAVAAERQMKRLRERYYEAILRQDIGWFDVNHAGALTTRITS